MTQALLAVPTRAASEQAPRTVRVAVAGCGVVGGHLLALIQETGHVISARNGIRLEVTRVLVRDPAAQRHVRLPPHVVTSDIASFLDTPSDIVVEALGGIEPANGIARAALGTGRHFITANKALVAAHGTALADLAHAAGARFAFEASVAGGVPVIRVLRDAVVHDDVRSISGILNGTTNYILSHMERGVPFTGAVAAAQAAGFAEADPSRDLEGFDAADKIRILAWLAFGAPTASVHVQRHGLLPDPDALVAAARAFGGSVRLIATTERLQHGVVAAVEPTLVASDSDFARTAAEDNLVRIETGWNGRLTLAGPGAGGAPTAAALLADLIEQASLVRKRTAGAPDTPAFTPPAVVGATDPRLHRWILTLPAATARPLDVLAAAGVQPTEVRQDAGYLHICTGEATRVRIASVCSRLTEGGHRVTRLRSCIEGIGKAEPRTSVGVECGNPATFTWDPQEWTVHAR